MRCEMRGSSRRSGGRRRLYGVAGFVLTAVLAVFHGQLLWHRLSEGSLLQPIVVARWAVSALLVLALLQLWSRGLPLLRGRRAGVLWLIVVLLHAMGPGGSVPAVQATEGMLPAMLAMLALLAFGLVAVGRPEPRAPRQVADRRRSRTRSPGTGWYPILFSRPPPAPLHS